MRLASIFSGVIVLLAPVGSIWGQNAPAAKLAAKSAPSFTNEVLPLMTKLGCNQGACHGKSSGQNGFRLSLRGYAPEWDHEWLTRELSGRRINPTVPEASLLLRKPLGEAPHEGGKLLARDGREHRLLLEWIRAGAPGPRKDDPRVERLELQPVGRILKPGQQQKLKVRAQFSDGTSQDVTWLSRFDSNDASVATVDAAGLARIVRAGETAVRASYQGQVAVAVLTAPHERPVKPERFAQRTNFIDDHVFKKLSVLRIEPSGLCTDEVFLRRVYLDVIGVLPTSAEVRAFLADKAADKRPKAIERLLERPEFVDFWTLHLAEMLQNRKEADHDVRGAKGVRAFHEWLRQQVSKDRPWDELARDILTAQGAVSENPAVGYFIVTVGENRNGHESTVVASAAQTFLGTRIGCAKCHNHPSEKYTQDDYYHFAGFFSRIRLERKDPKVGPTKLTVSSADPTQNKNPVGVVQPRTGQFLKPQPLDRRAMPIAAGDDPRRILADWITDPKNEQFAGAMVNRLWAHFFNVGLVEPIDDLRASNPPTNPELWRALVREFVKSKFSRKHMIRLIVNSRAYQLSAATKPSNAKDTRFYSHYYARRLPAEVLLDALCQATGVPEKFDGYPLGLRSVQIPDPSVKSYFLGIFGRSDRITACACERNAEVTLPQLLHLLGGDTTGQRLASPDGRLAALLRTKMSDREVIGEMFLLALGRLPRPEETARLERYLKTRQDESRAQAFQSIFWTVLNTREFAFNH